MGCSGSSGNVNRDKIKSVVDMSKKEIEESNKRIEAYELQIQDYENQIDQLRNGNYTEDSFNYNNLTWCTKVKLIRSVLKNFGLLPKLFYFYL